jgi:segregation and condensation protein B
LLDREWIKIVAHKEVPGRPAIFGTTKQFLDYFNLISLDELPSVQELQEFDTANQAEDSEAQMLEPDAADSQLQQDPSEEAEA